MARREGLFLGILEDDVMCNKPVVSLHQTTLSNFQVLCVASVMGDNLSSGSNGDDGDHGVHRGGERSDHTATADLTHHYAFENLSGRSDGVSQSDQKSVHPFCKANVRPLLV